MENHPPQPRGTQALRGRLVALAIVPALLIVHSVAQSDTAAHAHIDQSTKAKPSSAADPEVAAEETAAVDAARESYADAGLEFPDVAIRFHEDSANCLGHDGYYLLYVDGTATIDVCYPRQDPDVRHIPRARTLWHELAHAYIEPRIDHDTETALLHLLGLADWDEGNWGELGKENAAEILVWGIGDGRYRPREVVEFDCPTKAAAYKLLTGLVGPTC